MNLQRQRHVKKKKTLIAINAQIKNNTDKLVMCFKNINLSKNYLKTYFQEGTYSLNITKELSEAEYQNGCTSDGCICLMSNGNKEKSMKSFAYVLKKQG